MSKNFLFSVVTAAYNVELYLAEAIDSVIKQTIGFKKNIQLILVDDGSTDGTGAICDKYQKKYPENIVVIHKENGGVSSARNAGIEVATGKYINFLDADDKFSPESFDNVYNFFEQHYDETDIVTVPLHYFEGKTGGHYLNDKFKNGNRVIDLFQEPKFLLKNVNSSFFKRTAINNIKFDTLLQIGEDVKFCSEFLAGKMTLGVVTDAIYYYRSRAAGSSSATQSSKDNENYYFAVVDRLYNYLTEITDNYDIKFNDYYQNLLLNELCWRLRANPEKPDFFDDEQWQRYQELLFEPVKYITDKNIMFHDLLFVDHKVFLLEKKYGRLPDLIKAKGNICLGYNKRIFHRVSWWHTKIEIIEFRGDMLHIEGFMRFHGIPDNMPIRIYLSTGKRKIYCRIFDRNNDKRLRYGIPVYRDVGFKGDVKLFNAQTNIEFFCILKKVKIARNNISFGQYAPISTEYKNSYYSSGNRTIWYENKKLHVIPSSFFKRLSFELKFQAELIKKHKFKIGLIRLYYCFYKLFKHKEYWLVFDRVNKADDNGEAFFEYLRKYRKREVKAEFLIHKNTPDYKRIKRCGKVTDILSAKHKLHYVKCDKVVASNGEEFTIRPLGGITALRDISVKKKYVFLQHGVTKDDVSDWLNKYNKSIYRLITVTNAEYQSFLNGNYFYDKQNIVLTGFPRYDKLYNAPKKQIAIMPTWRHYLNGINDGGVWTAIEHFDETDYFKFYNSLLNDSRLLNAAKEHGYKIVFLPHPNIYQAYIKQFNIPAGVEVLDMNTKYSGVFAESNLLLTDYSSVAFDFAYLRKPVVYCQFDSEMFFSGAHSYDKGYFEYEKDGFGEVCTDLDSTVKTLISYIKDGCKLKDEYAERIENTFPFNDKNNCERVFNAIYKK